MQPLKRNRFVEETLTIAMQEATQAVSHLMPGGAAGGIAQTALGGAAQMAEQAMTGSAMTAPFQVPQVSGIAGATTGIAGTVPSIVGATPGFAGPVMRTVAEMGGVAGQAVQQGTINFTRFADVIVQAAPANLRAYAQTAVPALLQAAAGQNANLPQTAYMLATAQHESEFGAPHTVHGVQYPPLEEAPWHLAPAQTPQNYFNSHYDMPRHPDLGNQAGTDDGYNFRGRGYVQVTGRSNYQDWTDRLFPNNPNLDLVTHPEQAAEPQTAARILAQGMMEGTFTGRALPDYVNANSVDFTNARRVVNGTDRAADIAAIANTYQTTLQNAVQAESAPPTLPHR